jgi:hypothetical protein
MRQKVLYAGFWIGALVVLVGATYRLRPDFGPLCRALSRSSSRRAAPSRLVSELSKRNRRERSGCSRWLLRE